MKKKAIRQGAVACILTILMGLTSTAYADEKGSEIIEQGSRMKTEDTSAYRKGLELILATGDAETITLPADDSYLKSPEVKYVNAEHKNSIKSYRKPWNNKSALGAYPYHGMKVLVIAKQNEYDCIVFKDNNNESQVAWVHDEELTWYYPGEERTVGVPCVKYADNIGDAEVSWSEKSFDGSRQKYTILSEPAVNCVQFTLDYQVIGRGGAGVDDILGDRIIYVSDGTEWIEIGRFPYNEIDAVHVVVNLEKPMRVEAVAITADCKKPNAFLFRQSILNILRTEAEHASYVPGKYTFKEYTYELHEDGTTEVLNYNGSEKQLKLPAFLDGYPVTAIGKSALDYSNSLRSVTIPESVTSIGEEAFKNCESLMKVTFPEHLISIGDNAFRGCCNLKEVIIPENVSDIGIAVFHGCKNLSSVTIAEGVTAIENDMFNGCKKLTNVTIPETLISIGDWAFYDCVSLTNLKIPESVRIIGRGAFSSCINLTSVIIPEGVTRIGDSAFASCTNLSSATIPESVTIIGQSAFSSCTSLTSVIIPDSVMSIGRSTFSSCTGLSSVTIQANVTSIEEEMFFNCIRLRSITLPEGLKSIGDRAFYNCTSLRNIAIPESLTSIGYMAFEKCLSLAPDSVPD